MEDILEYELEKELKKKIFKASYYQFFKWAFQILEPQTRLEDTFHIKYICDLLQKEIERIIKRQAKSKDLIINVPPRTSKSKIVSQAYLAWIWILAPHLKMIAVSYDDKLSLANSQLCKDIIKSYEYQELFGDIFQIRKDIDSKEQFANNKGGVRLSVTTGSNITGFGAEIIVLDDPQNPKTSESEVERENTKRYYTDTLYNRLTPLNLGVRILVQQRLHFDDLTGALINPKGGHREDYEHICLPAEISKDISPKELIKEYKDGLLDPVRLGRTELAKLRKQGSRYFAGQYQQTPSPEEGGIIKRAWFEIIEPSEITREPQNEPIHFILDSAYTAKTENDPSAILTIFKKAGILYVLDAKEVWLEFPELIKFLTNHTKLYQISSNSKLNVEEAASGLSIIQTLRTATNMNVVGIPKPKDDKIARAHAITPKLESHRVKLVKGGYVDNLLAQLCAFPAAKHDDMVDCLIHAVNQFLDSEDTPDILWV